MTAARAPSVADDADAPDRGPDGDAEELRLLALRAATAAAPGLRARFGRPPEDLATKSGPTDLVSRADRDAEAVIVAEIDGTRGDDALRGEEGTDRAGRSGLEWLIDPLDGTTNFLWGIGHWAVSVGVRDADGVLAGVVLDPVRGEAWSAARGAGARDARGRTLTGPLPRPLTEATVGGDLMTPAGEGRRAAELAGRLAPRVGHLRSFGSVALDLAWLAAGRLDAVVHERGPQDWDVAAGLVLCREAGLRAELRPPAGPELPARLLAAPVALWGELEEALR